MRKSLMPELIYLPGLLILSVLWFYPLKALHAQGVREKSFRTDLNFLAAELPKRHIDLFANQPEVEFQEQVKLVDQGLSDLTYPEFQFELSRLVASLADGHTALALDNTVFHFFPLNIRWFDDQLAITAADSRQSDILGARLISINGLSIETVLEKLRPFFSVDNEFGFRNRVEGAFNNADLLAYACGFDESTASVEFVFEKEGKRIERKLSPVTQGEAKRLDLKFAIQQFPLYEQKSNLSFWNDWLADSRTLYFKYNRCQDAAGFTKLVRGTAGFVQQKKVERFVVDLRNNNGGNSAVFRPLRDYLAGQQQFRQPGKLFVIVGRGTLSSGLWAAYDLKKIGAIVVGEPTGGKPNHFGEIKAMQLPSTKLRLFYSTKYWEFLANEDPSALQPDLRVEYKAADYFASIDPALAAILKYEASSR